MLIAPLTMVSGQQAQEWPTPRSVYILETGHTLDQWREADGASTYGYPITTEIMLDDGTFVQYLQYLQYGRFEYYREGNAEGNYFALGDIGGELRPFSLQRSIASFTTTGSSDPAGAAATNAAFIRPWLPIDQPATESS